MATTKSPPPAESARKGHLHSDFELWEALARASPPNSPALLHWLGLLVCLSGCRLRRLRLDDVGQHVGLARIAHEVGIALAVVVVELDGFVELDIFHQQLQGSATLCGMQRIAENLR